MCFFDWPTIPEWIGALATVVLAGTAIWAGRIAVRQLSVADSTERHKRTVDLIKAYTGQMIVPEAETARPITISPMLAFATLDARYEDLKKAGSDKEQVRKFAGELMLSYIVLRNYLDEVDDYLSRGMIDHDFFMSRQSMAIELSIKMLRARAEFSETANGDELFLTRLEGVVSDRTATASPEKTAL